MSHVHILIALLLIGQAGAVAAQRSYTELDLQYGKAWIGDDLYGNPVGFSLDLQQRLGVKSLLKFSYSHNEGDDYRFGSMEPYFPWFPPDQPYLAETIAENYSLDFFQLGYLHNLSASKYRTLQAGIGVCLMWARETECGTTTGVSKSYDPDYRYGLALDVAIEDDFNMSHFVLRVSFCHRFFHGLSNTKPQGVGGYLGRDEPDAFTTTELRIGVG